MSNLATAVTLSAFLTLNYDVRKAVEKDLRMSVTWREARLIPTAGIKGAADQEVRATSALLSVLSVVPSFAYALLKPCGAPLGRVRANVDTFVEVAFEDKKKKRMPRPDGLIRVTRGNTVWTALVEVKTRANCLDKEQVESYMDIARDHGFDAVITISNEIPPVLGAHPVKIDGRKMRHTPVFHYSWVRLISLAVMEKEVRGIEDPEQMWILGELIKYLEHENSGALDFTDMGPSWTPVLDAVRTDLVRKDDEDVVDVASKFDALIRYICLKLGQRLGVEVLPQLSRKERENPDERTRHLADELANSHAMSARIRIPGAVADLQIKCDLRAKQTTTFAEIPASGHARNQTRVNWLLRPIDETLKDVVIHAHAARKSHAATIGEFREDPGEALPNNFPSISKFSVSQVHSLGLQKTTAGKSSFITSVVTAIDDFYISILQPQRTWSPPAPKYRRPARDADDREEFTSGELTAGDDTPDPEAHADAADSASTQPTV